MSRTTTWTWSPRDETRRMVESPAGFDATMSTRLMSQAELLSAVGLIRTSRRRGFCPACRLFQTGDGPQEVSAPVVMALAFLIVAALAWIVTIGRMSAMEDMPMGLGPLGPFVVAWTVMMAAMMFPSAMPLMFAFARTAERRRGWRVASALLGMT